MKITMERVKIMEDFERSWVKSKIPPWFKEFADSVEQNYKDARDRMSQIESPLESEFNQNMFYHQYQMSDVQGQDLHNHRRFLITCLDHYDKIPQDDRECSMDNVSSIVKDKLAEINKYCATLETKLDVSGSKDHVEICIELGNIENNTELLQHLKKCSEEDRIRLEQLLRCSQLVRLIFTLEEEALNNTFHRVKIPAVNETCLTRAYHLAKHGQPSDNHSKCGITTQTSTPESILYGSVKERVRSKIYSEVVLKMQGLEQVKLTIEKIAGKELTITDTEFVEDEFKKLCMKNCLEEMEQSMKSFLNKFQEYDIVQRFHLIDNVDSLYNIPDYFKELFYFEKLLKLKHLNKLDEKEETELVEQLKSAFHNQIVNYCNVAKKELGFIAQLTRYLSTTRKVSAVVSRMGLNEPTLKIDVNNIMNLNDLENNEECIELQCTAKQLQQETQFVMSDKIHEIIRGFMKPVQVQRAVVDGRTVVKVLGNHVILGEILESVENELAIDLEISEVHFIGTKVVHIDADLVNDIWHGKNVAVRSKLIKVHGTVVWDVSGRSCNHKYGPARSATTEGGDGCSGEDGYAGESGGNVLILTDQMVNGEEFTILSNGGNGGDGQDGGNGKDGQDGVGIKREKLEHEFKSPVRLFALDSTRTEEVQRMNKSIARNFDYISKPPAEGDDVYIAASAKDGKSIIFSCCLPKLLRNYSHCYLVYKGTLGKPGGQGGDYGRGGQGGFPGNITVKRITNGEMFNVNKSTLRGQDGRSGAAGLYGNTGNNGWDIGYIDYQLWRSAYYYGEDYKSKLAVTYHDDSRSTSVWCWYKNKYASITSAQHKNPSSEKHKKRHFGQRDRKHSAVAVMKKTVLESSFTASTDHHFGSIDEHALFNMHTRIEDIRQRALQGATEKLEQRTKASKSHRIHHIISYPNIEQDNSDPPAKISNTAKQIGLNSKILDNVMIRRGSMVNWKQLRFCRVEKIDLQRLFLLLDSLKNDKTKLSANDIEIIDQILVDKLRLISFEEIADKIRSDGTDTDRSALLAQYETICLEEDPQQCDIDCDDQLGTLDEYLFQFDCKDQQQKLLLYCEHNRETLPSSVVQAFLLEVSTSECAVSSIQTYLDQHNLLAQLKELDCSSNLSKFTEQLIQLKFADVIRLWYLGIENTALAKKLIHEVDRDLRLDSLHKRYIKACSQEINLNQCLQKGNFFESFRNLIVKKGPLTRCYRELLAFAFRVNIKIYTRNPSGKLSLIDNHNPKSTNTVYLLLQDNSFVKLRLNESLMTLENDRRLQGKKYSLIADQLILFNNKQLFDEYVLNHSYCDFVYLNDTKKICNAELLNEVIKYFPFRERHIIENLFTRSDVSSCVYSKLLRNICLRFAAEGKYVSTDEVHFLVNRYLAAGCVGKHEEDIVSWIVLAFPQSCWVSEILLLDLERYFKESLSKKSEWRLLLKSVENKALMILFSAKLELSRTRTVESIEKIKRILKTLSIINIQTEILLKLDLSEWYYVLEEHHWIGKLKKITNWHGDCSKLQEATYYAVTLLNTYGLEIMEKFFNTIKGKSVSDKDIIDVLCSFYNGRWNLTEENIMHLRKMNLEEWIKHMDSNMTNQQERGIDTVVQLIVANKWASKKILVKLPHLKEKIQKINKQIEKKKGFLRNMLRPNNLFNNILERFPGPSPNSGCFSEKSVEEQLLDIDDAIYEVYNFRLRNTQKFVVLTLLENTNNTLAQVATGEGKSLIVVAVAIIKASQGQKVDIITSSTVLAKRDAEQNKSIYAKFDINVSHNCSEDIEKRKEAYSGNQVVYGDLSSFQRDYLLHKFYQENIIGDRNFENVIVDEVDSMLLDRGNNMLYLSHDLPDMDKLESVYVFIWEWVNNISKVYDTATIRYAVLWQIYGFLKSTDIGKLDISLSAEQRNFIWKKLIEAQIIDDEGKLLTEVVNQDQLIDLLGSEYSIYLDRLVYLLRDGINREKCIYVPNYLRSFIDLHLESWIEAAKTALVMQAGHDYVVDVDRSGSSADRTPNVTILDRDTGTDMVNSQWEAALHQFVQLKHGCKTYLQSLKAVFISNVTYFKLYKKLYGLSGTLGSQRERDLLEEIYVVDFVNVPTAKCKQFYEDVPIVCNNAADWTENIIMSANGLTKTDCRSVLIICETLNEVAELYKAFGGKSANNVRTYTREYEEFDIGELPAGQIIIATNLAGRGTDIKITGELKAAGGVHVCLTYLPNNIRVEQQAFGRAARSGDRGSGQLIVLDQTESLNIMQLKRQRDTRELSRISSIKKHYETRVVLEEACFRKFTDQYDELRKLLSTSSVTKGKEELREILLGSCLDRWVYWLDKNGKNLVSNAQHHSRMKLDSSLEDFLIQLKLLNAENCESLLNWVDISTPRMIKLGRYFIENRQRELAHKLFDKVIHDEPKFAETALYFKAYALSMEIYWNEVASSEIKLFSQTLRSAADLFEERVQNLMNNVSVVDKVKTKFKENIIPITAYAEQKQIICKFYGALTQSIDDILGHPVTATSFEVEDIIDKSMSIEIFNTLLAKKIVLNPSIKDNIREEELRELSYIYGTSAAELLKLLESCRQNQGKHVQLEEFLKLLKQKLKLPSREGFWRHLLDQQILSNEEKFVVVDKTKLSFNEMQFLATKVSNLIRSKVTVHEGELLLYPDQLVDGDVYFKEPFKKAFGPTKYAAFKEIGAISFQRKASLSLDKLKTKQVAFGKYDSVSLKDFTMINISQNDANEIIDLLVRGKVLQEDNTGKGLYRLGTDYTKLKVLPLGSYKIYEDDVKGLLNLCFCYRFAFQGVATGLQDIPLISKPHRRILADLLYARIIEAARVSSKDTGMEDHFKALSGVKLEESCLIQVSERLQRLKGSMNYLQTVPFSEYDRYTNVEEWNLFSLNGNELLLKLKGPIIMKIVCTFLWGVCRIGYVLYKNFKQRKQSLFRQDLREYTIGWNYIRDALRMAFNVYGTDYYKLKYNKFLEQIARFESKYFGFFGERLNQFAFEVTQPVTTRPNIKHVRKLAVSLIRGFDAQSKTANIRFLIDERLQHMCTELSDDLLLSVDKNEAFSKFEDSLKKMVCSIGIDETKSELAGITGIHLKRQTYFNETENIFAKVANIILQAIVKATNRINPHKSVGTILSVDIQDAWVTALIDNEPNLTMIITNLLKDLAGKLDSLNSVESQTAITDCDDFIKEATLNLKEQLRVKLNVLLQQNIHRPVQEKGRFLLLNYADGQIELEFDTEEVTSPAEDFAKKIRIDQLKKESKERRQAQAMVPIENLLDQQFNASLAKWERNSTELERLAIEIRKGEPVDVRYLEHCLDAARFILLRQTVVVSSICINLVTDSGTKKKITSPGNSKGIIVDLHSIDNKFLVGITKKQSEKSTRLKNCLYDCLLQNIFELRNTSSKQFALDVSQHLIKISENKSYLNPDLDNFFNFNTPSIFKELCFAQFLNTCFECPSKGVIAYGDLMERAKNRQKWARDWHGTDADHVEVVTMHDSSQFVEAGFKKCATTDTIFGKVMSDLRKAFFKVYQ